MVEKHKREKSVVLESPKPLLIILPFFCERSIGKVGLSAFDSANAEVMSSPGTNWPNVLQRLG